MIITCAHILHFVGDVMYSLENFNPDQTALSFKLWKKNISDILKVALFRSFTKCNSMYQMLESLSFPVLRLLQQ